MSQTPLQYDYIERLIAPGVVEFYAKTYSSHRVIRIYLNHPTPRVMAITERAARQGPALIYLDELRELLKRAREITLQSKEVKNENRDSKSPNQEKAHR